jgi:mannose-6-phosphate isomerase-like protein (cupin superfamily)
MATEATEASDRQIRIHRGRDAPELHASGAAVSDFGTHAELQEIATRLASSECSLTRLLVHQGREEGGLSVVYLFFKPNFPLFRHQHDVDSLYVVISGSVVDFMGTEVLRPGDCFSVPARTPYYYTAGAEGVEVLEIFRDVDTVTVVYVDNPAGRVEQAQETVRANADAWRDITSGPLFRTRDQ